jgi:hypothetical protein
LPEGTYQVRARLQDTVSYQEVDQELSEEVRLDADERVELEFTESTPEFTSTPQFYAVALPLGAMGALLALLLVALLVMRRKGRRDDAGEEEGGEEKGVVDFGGPGVVGPVKGPAIKKKDLNGEESAEDEGKKGSGGKKFTLPEKGESKEGTSDEG